MSFQDIETGLAQPPHAPSTAAPGSPQEAAFLGLQTSLSLQVFKINANVQGISKLVDQLGTTRDTGVIRKSLHDLTDTTQEMARRGTEDLKRLTGLQAGLPQHKLALQRTSHDFQLSFLAFQRAQQFSAQRQRTVVEGIKLAVDDDVPLEETGASSPQQRQAQLLQQQLSPQELQHQESLIQEREAEIREIETGIQDVHLIFRDLATLVQEQGGMVDNIESNIRNVAEDTRDAANELTTASEYQRKAGRRAACLMIVLVIVTAIVLLAILN